MTKEEIEKMAEKTAVEVSNICNPEETNIYFRTFRKTLITIRLEQIAKEKKQISESEAIMGFLQSSMTEYLLSSVDLDAKKQP